MPGCLFVAQAALQPQQRSQSALAAITYLPRGRPVSLTHSLVSLALARSFARPHCSDLDCASTTALPRPPAPDAFPRSQRGAQHCDHHSLPHPHLLRHHATLPPLHHVSPPANTRLLLLAVKPAQRIPSIIPPAPYTACHQHRTISGSPLPRIPIPCRFRPYPRQGPRSPSRCHHRQRLCRHHT